MQHIPKSDSNWRHVLRWPAERHLLEANQGVTTELTFYKDRVCVRAERFTFIIITIIIIIIIMFRKD
jgi:hypothetical protein